MRYGLDGSLEIEEVDICYNCRNTLYGCPLVEMIAEGLTILAVPKGESITKHACRLYKPGLKVLA